MPGRPEVGYGSLVQTVIEIRVCACQYFTIAEMWLCALERLDRALLTPPLSATYSIIYLVVIED